MIMGSLDPGARRELKAKVKDPGPVGFAGTQTIWPGIAPKERVRAKAKVFTMAKVKED